MGWAKREMERLENLRDQARGILLETGAFSECPHGTALSNGNPDAERRAYALGTTRVSEGMVDGTREEFMKTIKSVIDDTGSECSSCQKIERE